MVEVQAHAVFRAGDFGRIRRALDDGVHATNSPDAAGSAGKRTESPTTIPWSSAMRSSIAMPRIRGTVASRRHWRFGRSCRGSGTGCALCMCALCTGSAAALLDPRDGKHAKSGATPAMLSMSRRSRAQHVTSATSRGRGTSACTTHRSSTHFLDQDLLRQSLTPPPAPPCPPAA